MSGRNLWQLIHDRRSKRGWYDRPAYWDMKATTYQGLARSNWPSNAYNEQLHARQMQIIDELLGDVAELEIADVGSGTGRTSVHLAGRGAHVRGFDFSPKAVDAAREAAEAAGASAQFEVADILAPPDPRHHGQFDVVLSLGCLTLACSSTDAFDAALTHLRVLLRPGGRLLFVEPIHESWLLQRILCMGVPEWIRRCERQGLRLRDRGGLLFVPVRYALAFRDLPRALVAPVFRAGERVLASSPRLERLSDYKWLLFDLPPEA
jgi:SAM-dependent methyltransferase